MTPFRSGLNSNFWPQVMLVVSHVQAFSWLQVAEALLKGLGREE